VTPLREIRTIHACPVVGEHSMKTRTQTSTFLIGADGVTKLELDEARGLVLVTGDRRGLAVPVAQCCWVEFSTVDPVSKVEAALAELDKGESVGSSSIEALASARASQLREKQGRRGKR
jgi:hypothetical protein